MNGVTFQFMELSPRSCLTNGEADAQVRTRAETSRVSRVLVRVRFPHHLTPSVWHSCVQPGICKRLLGACLERTRQEAVSVDSLGAFRLLSRLPVSQPQWLWDSRGPVCTAGSARLPSVRTQMERRCGQASHSYDQIQPQVSAECCRQPSVSAFTSPVILTLRTLRPSASSAPSVLYSQQQR